MPHKKILVTGASGFIGFHLTKRLADDGYEVFGLDNINDYYSPALKLVRLHQLGINSSISKNNSTDANFQPDANEFPWHTMIASNTYPNLCFIRMDLADYDRVVELMKQEQFDYVVNLAAQAGVRHSIQAPRDYTRSNIEGFLSILEGCRHTGVQHLVYASTSSVFGKNTIMPLSEEQSTEHPISLYSATKKANEMMAHSYSHLYDLPTTGLRFFTVYGPLGRPDMALFLFADAIRAGKPIKVFNHGNMIRDFTYVADIVESIARVLPKPAQPNRLWNGDQPHTATSDVPYQIFNIGNGQPVPLITYIEALEEALGRKAIKELLPMQPGDVPATHADTSALQAYTGFRPQTTVKEGVNRFVEWYMAWKESDNQKVDLG